MGYSFPSRTAVNTHTSVTSWQRKLACISRKAEATCLAKGCSFSPFATYSALAAGWKQTAKKDEKTGTTSPGKTTSTATTMTMATKATATRTVDGINAFSNYHMYQMGGSFFFATFYCAL